MYNYGITQFCKKHKLCWLFDEIDIIFKVMICISSEKTKRDKKVSTSKERSTSSST